MGVKTVSASDFRVHLKNYANQIAAGRLDVVMERHGFPMGVMVNVAEYEEFCRWRASQRAKPGETAQAAPPATAEPAAAEAPAGAEATGPQEPMSEEDLPREPCVPSAIFAATPEGRLHVPNSALSYVERRTFRAHPETMDIDTVEELYEATTGATNDTIQNWRGKAWLLLRLKGRTPAHYP